MTPKRILMFHPTHKTAVNSIAGLFPEASFEFARVPEIPLGPREALCTDDDLYPFERNIRILDASWRDVDELGYDLYITYPGMAWIVRKEWRIPGILLFLNTEDPFIPGFAWYVANTYSTYDKLPPIWNRSHIFPTLGRKAVGDWVGDYSGAYFINDKSFSDRQGVIWDRAFLDFLSLRVPFSRTEGLLPWAEHMAYRRRMRVYIELSRRKISCALLESMMMGQPVIAPDADDWNRVIENGKNGLLYEDRDEAADMIMSVNGDIAFARRLGAEGRKRAEEIAGDDVRRVAWERAFVGATK